MSQNSDQKTLHFIVGIARSGTSILNRLLNDHPGIHCLPEANFALFFLYRYKDRRSFTPADIELIFRQIHVYSFSHPWVGWDFDPEQTKKAVLERIGKGPLSYAALCKMIYSGFKVPNSDKANARLLIDKNPSYTLYAHKLKTVFPQAKFIFILRDYRANVLSTKQSADVKPTDVPFNAYRWKLVNKRMLRISQKFSSDVFIIRYEDLVNASEPEMLRLFRFLGVEEKIHDPVPPAKLPAFEELNVSDVYRQRFVKKYSDLGRSLNATRLSSWKQELSKEEITVCDALCSGLAKQFRYEPEYPLPRLKKYFYHLKYLVAILRACTDVYKELLIYYAPPALKLKRLEKIYRDLGFFRK